MVDSWVDVRVKTEAAQFQAVRSKIMGWPEHVTQTVYEPLVKQIAANAVELIKYIILTAPNKTKEPGRYDTGRMYDAVKFRFRPRTKGFSVFVGWIDGRPGYAIFQELGTSNGVKAMNAIGQASEYILSELKKAAAGSYSASPTGFNFDAGGEE